MTIAVMRSMSRLIGALPALVLGALTSAPVAAAEPRILLAEKPAILILIAGEPVYQPLKGTDRQRIPNTKPFIVRDSAGIHYLKVLDGWMERVEGTSSPPSTS
jgi:hypothetical protein